jgi:hypothetical protein
MWETVAVSAIAVLGTLGSASLSYLAAKGNTKQQLVVSERSIQAQLDASEKTIEGQLDAANLKAETDLKSIDIQIRNLDATQAEELRSARQALYQGYLEALLALRDYFSSGGERDPSILKEYRSRDVEVELLGSEVVVSQTDRLYHFVLGILSKAGGSSDGDTDRLADEFHVQEQKWKELRGAIKDAMRRELGRPGGDGVDKTEALSNAAESLVGDVP